MAEKNRSIQTRREFRLLVYILYFMLVTRDTTHFEISPLNIDASRNAVQSVNNKIQKEYNRIVKQETILAI